MSADSFRGHSPFYRWVPRPLGILILLFMFVPPTFSGGAYISNVREMSGALALLTEDVQLASFFTSIGMCLFVPFMLQFLQARRIRHTYLWCFGMLVPLNYICAVTTSVPVLLGACLLIGFVRMIVMLNCTFTLAPYLTGIDTLSMFTMTEVPAPDVQYRMERMRTFLMPVLYCFILLIAQSSNVVTAWFADRYSWRDAYYGVITMLLMAILAVIVTMPAEKKRQPYRIEWHKVPELIMMTAVLCCMAYVLVFGKTLGWFGSRSITLATAAMLISCGAFILLSVRHGDEAYLPFGIFRYRNTWMAMLLFLAAMVFNSADMFVGMFSSIATPASSLHNASLSLWAIAGCIAGLVVSLLLVLKKVRFRTTFVIGLLFMAASGCIMYFQYQTQGLFSNMIWPTVLNFTGLLMLYSLVAAFGMKSLPSRYLITFVFLMIWMRNAIAPVIGTSVYSNRLYERQQYHITRLARGIDALNPEASALHMRNTAAARASGMGSYVAGQYSATVMNARTTLQATIVAMKEITGNTVILILAAAGIVLILPYRKNETT